MKLKIIILLVVSSGFLLAAAKETLQEETPSYTSNYEENLMLAKMSKPAVEQLEFKIELPDKATLGEKIKITVYPPTIIEIESVTFLIGISNYVDLPKNDDGSFVGYFSVPESFKPGDYICSFYFRLEDGSRTRRQRNLQVIDFYKK